AFLPLGEEPEDGATHITRGNLFTLFADRAQFQWGGISSQYDAASLFARTGGVAQGAVDGFDKQEEGYKKDKTAGCCHHYDLLATGHLFIDGICGRIKHLQ